MWTDNLLCMNRLFVEDMGELRKQVRTLEDKNHSYMQQTLELEDELRKSSSLKTQLESYRKQVNSCLARFCASVCVV